MIFFVKRIETVFLELGISVELIKLFNKQLLRDPLNAFNQANVLKELKNSPEKFSLLLDTTNRVSKIINGNLETGRVSKALFEEDIETIAFNQFNQITNPK